MKKILALILAVVMVFALAACTTAPATEETTADETAATDVAEASADGEQPAAIETLVPGKLTVATSPDFAPYEFFAIDENGNPQLAGFDIALAQYIADYLGLELDVIQMDFDGVLNELANGSVDLGISGLSPDPKREDTMSFSNLYYESGQCFVTVASKADALTDVDVANDPQYSIGAQNGSIQYDLAMQYTPEADVIALTKVTDIVGELLNDKLDGAFIEEPVAKSYAANYPELVIVCNVPYEAEGAAVGVIKGNEALLNAVNEAVAAAKADGSMDRFVAEANELAGGEIYEGIIEG